MPAYEDMTVEQLDELNRELSDQRDRIKMEQKKIIAVRDRKLAEIQAAREFEAMSDVKKEALRKIIGAKGIASGESVGIPR